VGRDVYRASADWPESPVRVKSRPYTDCVATTTSTLYRLDRGYVAVSGPQASDFLERMLSNEVASLEDGESRPALLLTPKGRIIAPLRAVREGPEAFLLITEAELAEPVASALTRARFAARCEIETKHYRGYLQLGAGEGIRNGDYGVEACETWGEDEREAADPGDLEALRIEAGTPVWGKELDESVLPAEAGLDETHISFTKGCYPGQEPVARLHYRGHPNRQLRVLELENANPGDELVYDGKTVGRVTSAVPGRALGYVRREVPAEARLHSSPARP
jgi:folate-binding protein YgfZ